MRRRELKLLLFAALCSAWLPGCGSLRWGSSGDQIGSLPPREAAAPSQGSAPASQTGLPASPANAGKPAASDPQMNLLEGQFAMARLCERRGESEQAEQMYCALLQKAPQDARVHHRLAVLAVKKADFAKADEQFRLARTFAPPTAELLSDIGYSCYLQQQFPQAEETLRAALNLEPTCATAINNLALVLGREGRFQESLDLFKRTNSEAEAYANLAYVFSQNGKTAQAKEMYLRALTLDNTMRAAAQAMLQIEEHEQVQTKLASARAGAQVVGPPAGGQTAEAISDVDKRSL
jgi:Flp pilus assembly protein TadD